MSGINFVNSVAPSYNALSQLVGGNLGGMQGVGQAQRQQGPLGLPNLATAFRPPTAVKEENIFGQHQGYREPTQEENQQYAHQWRSDRRNQGYGQGQVDPRLAAAANQKDEQKSGGK